MEIGRKKKPGALEPIFMEKSALAPGSLYLLEQNLISITDFSMCVKIYPKSHLSIPNSVKSFYKVRKVFNNLIVNKFLCL